ncbi:hypothetical protein A6B41_04630 [Mannheimia granulomatis]|nr:hypothetical protein A6B41_04630 [Mannheimia granulomatis]
MHALQTWLYQHIPATALLDIQLEQADLQAVRLRANFAKNRNHHNTMFGGSMALISTACGWLSAFVQTDQNPQIVIKRSEIDYQLPATGDLIAVCQPISTEQMEKCQKMLKRFGRGTLHIACQLICENKLAALWQGEFVVYAQSLKH